MAKFHEDTEPIALNRASDSDTPKYDHSMANTNVVSGWKYRRCLGSLYYASPQVQLVLVAFVCFLCPGMWCIVILSESGL